MKPMLLAILFILALVAAASGVTPSKAGAVTSLAEQKDEPARIKTRERLERLLDKVGPTINVAFSRSKTQPFNYVGSLTTGLVHADSLEVVAMVTPKDTINFRVYPHYRGGYINVDKARDRISLMRSLLSLSGRTFLFWGIDEGGDVFTGYTFTLESGFPDESINTVLRSIPNSDKFVGELSKAVVPATRPQRRRRPARR
jgi:hypothetical protein